MEHTQLTFNTRCRTRASADKYRRSNEASGQYRRYFGLNNSHLSARRLKSITFLPVNNSARCSSGGGGGGAFRSNQMSAKEISLKNTRNTTTKRQLVVGGGGGDELVIIITFILLYTRIYNLCSLTRFARSSASSSITS